MQNADQSLTATNSKRISDPPLRAPAGAGQP